MAISISRMHAAEGTINQACKLATADACTHRDAAVRTCQISTQFDALHYILTHSTLRTAALSALAQGDHLRLWLGE